MQSATLLEGRRIAGYSQSRGHQDWKPNISYVPVTPAYQALLIVPIVGDNEFRIVKGPELRSHVYLPFATRLKNEPLHV